MPRITLLLLVVVFGIMGCAGIHKKVCGPIGQADPYLGEVVDFILSSETAPDKVKEAAIEVANKYLKVYDICFEDPAK